VHKVANQRRVESGCVYNPDCSGWADGGLLASNADSAVVSEMEGVNWSFATLTAGGHQEQSCR
jgi:hypothetical protein